MKKNPYKCKHFTQSFRCDLGGGCPNYEKNTKCKDWEKNEKERMKMNWKLFYELKKKNGDITHRKWYDSEVFEIIYFFGTIAVVIWMMIIVAGGVKC